MSLLHDPVFYRHTKRPEWGLGILASEDDVHTKFQFEDGQLRTFANEYVKLLQPVAAPKDAEALVEELSRGLETTINRDVMARTQPSAVKNLVSLDDQITAFLEAYPQGFADPAWRADVRGTDAKKRLKAHRDPAVEQAQRILSQDRMDELIGAGNSGTLWDGMLEIMRKTDLVTPKEDVEPMVAGFGAAARNRVVAALRDMLYGEDSLVPRFDRWVSALAEGRKIPSWQAATTLLGLVDPKHHCVIRHVMFRRQSKWMAPNLDMTKNPCGRAYRDVLEMARAVETSLTRKELEPRDLMDVYDFIKFTMRPGATRS